MTVSPHHTKDGLKAEIETNNTCYEAWQKAKADIVASATDEERPRKDAHAHILNITKKGKAHA